MKPYHRDVYIISLASRSPREMTCSEESTYSSRTKRERLNCDTTGCVPTSISISTVLCTVTCIAASLARGCIGLSLEAVAGGGGQLHTYFLHAHVALWGIAVVSVGVALGESHCATVAVHILLLCLALVQTGHQLLASLEDSG